MEVSAKAGANIYAASLLAFPSAGSLAIPYSRHMKRQWCCYGLRYRSRSWTWCCNRGCCLRQRSYRYCHGHSRWRGRGCSGRKTLIFRLPHPGRHPKVHREPDCTAGFRPPVATADRPNPRLSRSRSPPPRPNHPELAEEASEPPLRCRSDLPVRFQQTDTLKPL